MKRFLTTILIAGLIVMTTDCRDPFEPDFATGVNDYLVVEGYVNVGEKAVTKVILSRLSPLGAPVPVFESGAKVTIENELHETFPVVEKSKGNYFSDSLNLDPHISYRLLIRDHDGTEYASQFVKAKITPKIDSVYWQWQADGIHINIATHDSETSAHYYKWNYEETWEIRSEFKSEFKYHANQDSMSHRMLSEMLAMYKCWQSSKSDLLRYASTTQFSSDQISYSLVNHGVYSDKLQWNYTILATQRTMTEEEFNYLELIQKNTTVTGSLFDPMPSELHGNILSITNPGEQVIGYVGAYTTEQRRLYITPDELNIRYNPGCKTKLVPEDSFFYYFVTADYTPIDSIGKDLLGKLIYSGAFDYCLDCTTRGTNERPDVFKE
jgi:hypothetical protein